MPKQFLLSNLKIKRSEKILWRFPYNSTDVLSNIKSKSLKKFLQKADLVLEEKNISVSYLNLDKTTFLEWLPYYQKIMQEQKYDVIASETWFDKKMDSSLKVEGIFFYHEQELIASCIVTREGSQKATLAFKASDRLDLTNDRNSSIGSVADYFFLRKMVEERVSIISSGRSRNAFGVFNTIGYLDYKLRLGYQPLLEETPTLIDTVPLNDEGVVLFYGLKDNTMALYVLKPKGYTKPFEVARFTTHELPFVELEY